MRRKLSSRQTFLAKFVIPATIFAVAAALLAIFFAVPQPTPATRGASRPAKAPIGHVL